VAPSISKKLALTSPTRGGRSVRVVHSRTQTTEFSFSLVFIDRLCGLVVRVVGYRTGDPSSIPATTRKKVVGLERGPLSLVSTTEEILNRKVAAPV
jgi:hypothetical protein